MKFLTLTKVYRNNFCGKWQSRTWFYSTTLKTCTESKTQLNMTSFQLHPDTELGPGKYLISVALSCLIQHRDPWARPSTQDASTSLCGFAPAGHGEQLFGKGKLLNQRRASLPPPWSWAAAPHPSSTGRRHGSGDLGQNTDLVPISPRTGPRCPGSIYQTGHLFFDEHLRNT